MIVHADGRFQLIPVRMVATTQPMPAAVQSANGWLPPWGYDGCTQWTLDNRLALEQYASEVETHGTAAEQLQRYLDEHPEALGGDDAKI